ncbi:MAG: ABC-type transport system permease component [Caulobacteraceae bacterium]|nr:ABC-type transport system permease component [Caulobacteraceae bacterium]
MNRVKLIGAFIRRRPLTWGFHALTLALGVAVLTAVLALNAGLSGRFQRDLGGIDLVVGAKGSPLQLIMSAVFQLDQPTGNIPLPVVRMLAGNRLVQRAVPVSLGDNVGGFRIVGTSTQYPQIYDARLAAGRWWSAPMEAVVGAQANRSLRFSVGQAFVGDHGLARGGETHRDSPYRVVGVLAPTGAVIDRLVLTDTASVWKVHERETLEHLQALNAGKPPDPNDINRSPGGREVTAVLVKYRSAMGALMLPRYVAAMPNLQAASPAVETAHLTTLLGTGAEVLRAFAVGLLALSAVGFFVALYAAVSQRRRELALLRTLGARPSLLFALVTLEGLALGLTGGVAGIALGRAAAVFAAHAASRGGGPSLPLPPIGGPDLMVLAGALLLSLLAALAPGFVAYRTRPAAALGAG